MSTKKTRAPRRTRVQIALDELRATETKLARAANRVIKLESELAEARREYDALVELVEYQAQNPILKSVEDFEQAPATEGPNEGAA